MKNEGNENKSSGQKRKKFSGRKSGPKSLLQQSIDLGIFLYSQKENFFDKAQEIMSRGYKDEKSLGLEEIKDKVMSLGRMVKAVFEGEYKGVSPVFLI